MTDPMSRVTMVERECDICGRWHRTSWRYPVSICPTCRQTPEVAARIAEGLL